jgi:SAM-dependent methyltransferase
MRIGLNIKKRKRTEMKLDLAYYTAFYGSNHNIAQIIPSVPSKKYKCYYFTNNKKTFENLKKTDWIGIFDDKESKDDLIESCFLAKHVKVNPHVYEEINKYSYLIWLDTKLAKLNETLLEELIETYFIRKNYALILREHPWVGGNVRWEYYEAMTQHRYRLQKERYLEYIDKQLKKGFKETTNIHCANGLLLRNMKHPKINEINEAWYDNIVECGIEDQISFFFVRQMFESYIYPFPMCPFVNNSYCIRDYTMNKTPELIDTENTDTSQKEVYEFCAKFMTDNKLNSVLDIGCGNGVKLMKYLQKFHTLGLETSTYISDLQEKYPNKKWLLSGEPNRSFVYYSDMKDLDMVLCANIIETIVDPEELIKFLLFIDAKYYILSTLCRGILTCHEKFKETHFPFFRGPPVNKSRVIEWNDVEMKRYLSPHFDIVYFNYCKEQIECQFYVLKKK